MFVAVIVAVICVIILQSYMSSSYMSHHPCNCNVPIQIWGGYG